ncbi:hypothetical protein N1851_010256 [Merluccius polli]|uniref:Uncharacterized protein n=1 Tax=Merluccius polli TaxID=89951 RepID=A0AA47MYX6_MERPO|nr:hypothetical protein N1851_010256 [Merluccius polli]
MMTTSAEVFSVFPRFLDTTRTGMASTFIEILYNVLNIVKCSTRYQLRVVPLFFFFFFFKLQIEQDFRTDCLVSRLPTSSLERWPTTFKQGALKESLGLTGTSVQQHLDNIAQSSQPYLLAQGPTKSSIHSSSSLPSTSMHFHAKPPPQSGALDELFKAHYVFVPVLNNLFHFSATSIYNIDVGKTKETPRIAELRARMVR